MQYCDYCRAELPENANFCGRCGYKRGDLVEGVERGQPTLQFSERQTGEDLTIWPDTILPYIVEGQGPPPGTVPAVQGTPQVGNLPVVHGPPHFAGNAPPAPGLVHQAPPSVPQNGWAGDQAPAAPQHMEGRPIHQPSAPSRPQHPQQPVQRQSIHHLHHPHQPVPPQHPPAQTPGEQHEHEWREHERHEKHEHEKHEHERHEHEKRRHEHRQHDARGHVATASKFAMGTAAKWAVVLLIALVVLATGGVVFVAASSPSLSLGGDGTVSAGGVLHIRGHGFVPGGHITLTIDNGMPVAQSESRFMHAASLGGGLDVAGAVDMLAGGLMLKQASSNGAVSVSIFGTFDTNIGAQSNWSAGKHVLHASEDTGSRSASLSFTLLAQSARLSINPATLDFGSIPAGSKVAKSVRIGNTGSSPLNWNASTDGSPWLTLDVNKGTVQPGAIPQTMRVTIDSAGLAGGNHTGAINIASDGGNASIAVSLVVANVTQTRSPSSVPSPSLSQTPSPSPSPTPSPSPSPSPTPLPTPSPSPIPSPNPTPTPTQPPVPTDTPTPVPVTLSSGTWNDPYGGASYGTGEPVTIVLTVSGSNVSGTMKGDISGDTTPITGQTGPLSSFSQQDQGFLDYVIQKYGSGTGVFLVYQNTQDFIGAYAGSTYYLVLQSNGTLQGFWYFPNQQIDTGALTFNPIS